MSNSGIAKKAPPEYS